MIYRKNRLEHISFPLGGIGTGSIGLAGNGALVDWEIFNRPNKGSLNGYTHFAVKAELPNGRTVTKVLMGDHLTDLMGQYERAAWHRGFGYGPSSQTMAGFPHFQNVTFDGRFPIARLTFTDDDFPARVTLTAFNPFIPLDAEKSSIPAALFQIGIQSFADNVKYTVVFSVCNPFQNSANERFPHRRYTAVRMTDPAKTQDAKEYGDLTVAVDETGFCQEYWYRGSWQDGITTFWRELSDGALPGRHFDTPGVYDTCSVGAQRTVNRTEETAFRFVLAWNVPNFFKYWKPSQDENGRDIVWKNYYATVFPNSTDTCFHCLDNWDELFEKTDRFCRTLHGSTLDSAVIDAVSSTLSVLKSPTVLRLEDGSFYGWEGVSEVAGSCQGTCTHVWSYAYALCFLFPELERSLRNTEFRYNTDPDGRMHFRTALPLGRTSIQLPPCLDGQMATVIKIYRDWKITGDSQWLRENWPHIRKILEYAWSSQNDWRWDRDKDGVLEGRQHHTLDMEIFGPSSWLQGMYLAALKAATEMADFLGDHGKQAEYADLFRKGYAWTKENLFNGNYFYHRVDLQNRNYIEQFQCPDYWNAEKGELKYQIGDGCEIDQLLGQWHANICGLGNIFDKIQRQTALKSMVQNNFKETLRSVTNMWRNFALNDESGTIMCDYPHGAYKPVIPIPYCEECMTGFEYAFAGLLISEGFVDEGLRVIRAVRNRYNGEKRNPWNEIECGSNYARAMASFALLPIFSGLEFDLPRKHIGFSPITEGIFRCFWCLGTGWGEFVRIRNKYKITVSDGELELESLSLGGLGSVISVRVDGKAIPFTQAKNTLHLKATVIHRDLVIRTQASSTDSSE